MRSKWLLSFFLLVQSALVATEGSQPTNNTKTVSTRILDLWTWIKALWNTSPTVPIVSILMLCILGASLYNFFKKETNVKRGIQLILVAAALANIMWLLTTIWGFRL